MSLSRRIRVLVVDDSAVVRQALASELGKARDIEVVGTAPDPYVARNKILSLCPDVITLDVEMPRMDGLTFLRKIMQHHPIPVIIVSSLTRQGSEMAMDALEAGAVDVLCKPGVAYTVGHIGTILIEQIRAVSNLDARQLRRPPSKDNPPPMARLRRTSKQIIAIGASTGGTVAIERVLRRMPANSPGIVMVQHMPESFTRVYAERLNQVCSIEVREARDGDRIQPGCALLAPGNFHMCVARDGAMYCVRLNQGPRVHYQRPAVDNLFFSIAEHVGANAVATLLTGMGKDGALGLLAIREAQGRTIVQDKESCVVYGMPAEAMRLGAAEFQFPLDDIAARAIALVNVA
ncbi:MAG TPA: chemotaxis response regulator protein-glutamate methylesterase [Fibrobacteraceae bacterium]|nr:chemotaxis response regulator protein-glutamate methylesterase [Fibrobacteraceae bacterium]